MLTIKASPLDCGRIFMFSDRVAYRRYPFAKFVYCSEDAARLGYVRRVTYTKVIDLRKSEEELFASFNKDTKYKIRRSERENVRLEIGDSIDELIEFYNGFARQKGLELLDGEVEKFSRHLAITKACLDDDVLVMHAYLVDRESRRLRLNISASQFRGTDDKAYRALVGRANKYLHYISMMHFKAEGFQTYDLGGYAFKTDDPDLDRINQFKDSFRGELVRESTYTAVPWHWFLAARQWIRSRSGA